MSNEATAISPKERKKKSIFRKWWFWVSTLIVLVIVIASATSGGGNSTIFELGKATQMSKQQIIDKFGKPNEVIREDKDGYSFAYNGGFTISGSDQGADNIMLSSDLVKSKSSDSYKIFDIQLNSSFQENVKTIGEPQLSLKKDKKNLVAYLTKEGLLLTFSSNYDEDKISAIELSQYDSSTIAPALDVSNLLGNMATENDIKQSFTIKNKSTDSQTTTYVLNGFELVLDNNSQIVKQVIISSDSIYNIHGVRITDLLDKATKLFGNALQTKKGVKDTTQYTYNYDNNNIILGVENTSKKIQYIGLLLQ